MLKKLRKSSSRITLVLIGLTALSGCSEEETRRDVYANKEDCLADWGNNPADCEPAKDRPRSSTGGMFWYGRPYANHGSSMASRAVGQSKRAISSSTVSRGGFGSSGRSSSG